jgi:hypothetical protein
MCQNLGCIDGLPNVIEVKWWFHGNLGIVFHIELEHSMLKWLSKGEIIDFDSPLPMIFGLQYHAFSTSKCFIKLASHSGCSQYCGYMMPMATSNAH